MKEVKTNPDILLELKQTLIDYSLLLTTFLETVKKADIDDDEKSYEQWLKEISILEIKLKKVEILLKTLFKR
jgi:hypothetical protein